MSVSNRKKALGIASAGAYCTAVYVTYQFLTPPPQETPQNGTASTNTNCHHCCTCFTTDPKRTQQFQKIADSYDAQINKDEIAMGMPLLRRALLYFNSKGDCLEVAAGTGRNLKYYPSSVNKVVLTDNSDQMLMNLRRKVREFASNKNNPILQMFVGDAQAMTKYYPENSFDTVVDTFGLCSFDDPVRVLKEMQKICKPDGKILLLEHGRSKTWEGLSNYLDKNAERHAKNWGCVWNRDIDLILEESGLVVETIHTWHFGTTYYVVCRPGDALKAT